MPLKPGTSKKVVQSNIKEGLKSYEQKGTFGNSHPSSKKKAIQQIVAASYSKARKGKK